MTDEPRDHHGDTAGDDRPRTQNQSSSASQQPTNQPSANQQQNSQSQQQQNSQSQQYNQQQGGGRQDIKNAQWLTFSRDEEIMWWGHPSLIPHAPIIGMSVLFAIIGTGAVFILPETVGLKGLLAIPVGLVGAGTEYARVITTFYVVTNDKVVRKVGVIRRNTIEMRYENIEHVNAKQSLAERLFGFGDIELATAGTSSNEAYLDNVREPRRVAQTINQQKDNAYNQLAHEKT